MSEDKTSGEAQCLQCSKEGARGCFPCRLDRILREAHHLFYEKMGAEQNQAEWEERCLKAESDLSEAKQEIRRREGVSVKLAAALAEIERLEKRFKAWTSHCEAGRCQVSDAVVSKLHGEFFPSDPPAPTQETSK